VVAFDPFTPGSPFCPGQCTDITGNNLDYVNLVRAIDQVWPGNETIGTWLDAYDNGVANVPTEDQIERAIDILQQGFWSFGNPSPEPGTGPDYTETVAQWYQFWTSLGLDPSNNLAPSDFSGSLAALTGAFSPEQLADTSPRWGALLTQPTSQPTGPRWRMRLTPLSSQSTGRLWSLRSIPHRSRRTGRQH
jgi:hypothetical protein